MEVPKTKEKPSSTDDTVSHTLLTFTCGAAAQSCMCNGALVYYGRVSFGRAYGSWSACKLTAATQLCECAWVACSQTVSWQWWAARDLKHSHAMTPEEQQV